MSGLRARLIAAGLAVATIPVALIAAHPATAATAFTPPAIKHVWVIELENKSYDAAFAQNTNTYTWKTLPSQGVLLRQYYGTGHNSLDNYISELSGQAPNIDTQGDCQNYMDIAPGIADPTADDGQIIGQGCVYPSGVKTITDQLTAKGLTWRGYMQDMGLDPTREEATCGRPFANGAAIDPSANGGLGGMDGTQSATAQDQYAARHNPLIYFHSVIDDKASCNAHVVPLVHEKTGAAAGATDLATDLKSVKTTPNFTFITPNLCDDAHDATCAGKNQAGNNQGGLFAADLFLKKYVPMIQASPAYQQDGMIVVTLDESGDVGTTEGDTGCCGEPTGPNTTMPGLYGPTASGGGRIGTIILSKRFVKPGTVSDVPYNHYSMLRSMEDLYRIGATPAITGTDGAGHLGYAGQAGLVPFGKDVYNLPAVTTPPRTAPTTRPTPSTPPRAGGSLPTTGLPLAVPGIAGLLLLAAAAVRRRRTA